MKKEISVLLALVLALSLSACDKAAKPTSTPEDTVKTFSDAMQGFDLEAMRKCLMNPNANLEDEIKNDDFNDAVFAKFKEWAQSIEYEVTYTNQSGDTAKVYVRYNYVDSAPAIAAVFEEYLKQAFAMTSSGASDEEIDALWDKALTEKLATTDVGSAQSTVTYELTKSRGEWKINEVPDEVLNVITANFLYMFEGLEEAFGEP